MATQVAILPREIYRQHLKVIGGIEFTSKEVSVMSCIANGCDTPHEIAKTLYLKDSPLELHATMTHIFSIGSKIKGYTTNIVHNFIARAPEYQLISDYYYGLRSYSAFVQTLKKLKNFISNIDIATDILKLVITHSNRTNDKDEALAFLNYVMRHFKILGIHAVAMPTDDNKDFARKGPNTKVRAYNDIRSSDISTTDRSTVFALDLQKLSSSDSEHKSSHKSHQARHRGIADSLNIQNDLYNRSYDAAEEINVISGNAKSTRSQKTQVLFHIHTQKEQKEKQDYYFLFFEILQTLFPGVDLGHSVEGFRKQYHAITSGKLTKTNKTNTLASQVPSWPQKMLLKFQPKTFIAMNNNKSRSRSNMSKYLFSALSARFLLPLFCTYCICLVIAYN
jgi:hypothetical protein